MTGRHEGPARTPDPVPRPRPTVAGEDRRTTWRRLRRMAAPRLTRANLLATGLTIALGFAIATQIQQTAASGLQNLRQDELVRILDDVTQRSSRLDNQVRELEAQRDTLKSSADSTAAAVTQAQRRLDQLSILAGTAPVQGPGVRITIADPDRRIRGALLLDVLQELRDAGAEVVQYGSVRIVASSAFTDQGETITVDGQALTRPIVILAVGEPQTIAKAMAIPGGVVATVRREGASASVEELSSVVITAVRQPITPRFATPAPEPTVGSTGR